MTKDPNEVVTIVHPEIDVAGSCTRRQLEQVWADRGWKAASESDETPLATTQRSKGPNTTRARREERAARRSKARRSRPKSSSASTAPGSEG